MILEYNQKWFDELRLHLDKCFQDSTFLTLNEHCIQKIVTIISGHSLIGYHCTRLTKDEIENIIALGLSPLSEVILCNKITDLEKDGQISKDMAQLLKHDNQANHNDRKGLIWFCFFPPHEAGESGIERFFRSWGGEALYSCHESDTKTGSILRKIGTPCIVKAKLLIGNLNQEKLAIKIMQDYMSNPQINTQFLDYEDCTKNKVLPENIQKIIRFPEPEFIELTKCYSWNKSLL